MPPTDPPNPIPHRSIEKIIAHHGVGLTRPFVAPGEAVCVRVDWTMANELTLVGITDSEFRSRPATATDPRRARRSPHAPPPRAIETFIRSSPPAPHAAVWKKIGKPPVADKERVWLAVDHTVDPRNYTDPKPTMLIKLAEDFAEETHITDYWKPNTTIMHTEFARQRAQPGQIVIGADSHTCSAGGMGALAIGLGAGDVTLPLVTGHTWIQVPEVCLIEFVGEPRFGVGGKDIILHVLGVLKRNTVANERAVEWAGPGLRFMSADARFAVANMTTEFGGIAGVFEADEQTARALASRREGAGAGHRADALYFRADPGAEYAFRHTIDLATVEPMVALFPSPDNCHSVAALAPLPAPAAGAPSGEGGCSMPKLDGCFIGACTTTQEDLILGALVLEEGLRMGLVPVAGAKRRVTPGSLQIIEHLKRHGLIDIYERAGFVVGVPGCSYCLGIAADIAGDSEVWLSSQNRNFKNRMGKGSLANLASAAVVAASSFSMTLTDPAPLLARVDRARFDLLREWVLSASPASCHGAAASGGAAAAEAPLFSISEPAPVLADAAAAGGAGADDPALSDPEVWKHLPTRVAGRVQRFGDMVDTDAIIPAPMMGCSEADMVKYGGVAGMGEDAFLGLKCFTYVRPEFYERVQAGSTIVVGGEGFGCGSSREEAVKALKFSGVKAVIAKSFAFIYARNQPNMSLLGVVVKDEAFYALANEGAEVEVDVTTRTVSVAGRSFSFALSTMEERFLQAGGVEKLYKVFKQGLFKALVKGPAKAISRGGVGCGDDDCGPSSAAGGGADGGKTSW